MIYGSILVCVCLWQLVDATDEMKAVSVIEGGSITLHTDVSDVQKCFLIQWMFGSIRIAEVNRLTQTNFTYGGPEERFRNRLHLDQTGSLTINDTRNTDSGHYKLTIISRKTSYMTYKVEVYESSSSETPHTSSSPKSSSSSNFVSSSCVVNNSTINQTKSINVTELHESCSDHIHCCGFTETVIRLVASALVSVAAVSFLVHDIKSTRSELKRMEEARHKHRTRGVKSDQQYELSRRISSRYVC